MRIVIVGASRFGAAIADTLIEEDHEVVMIDKDKARLEALANSLDCGMLQGDGTLPTVLREVFRDGDDVFVSVTNASEDNILAALVARSVGFGRVIPQIVSQELLKVCHELDLDHVINPHATVAREFADALQDRAEMDHETRLSNQLALKRVLVPKHLDGTRFDALGVPPGTKGVALIRDGNEHHLSDDTHVQKGDHLLLVLDRDGLDDLSACFADAP